MAEAAAEAETAAGSAAVAVAAAAECTGVEKGAVTDEGAEAPVAAKIGGAEVEIGPEVAEIGKTGAGAIRFVIRIDDDGRCYSQCPLRFGGAFATRSSFQ